MTNQAGLAGVSMDAVDRKLIANPVLHDKSNNLLLDRPTDTSADRDVRYADGTVVKQRKTTDQGMTYADTQRYIVYKPDPNTIDSISGTVDARGYLEWLNKNHYGLENLIVH